MNKDSINQRIQNVTPHTLIVGVDIAKNTHWARFVDSRGVEIGNAISFSNDRQGFEILTKEINEIIKHSRITLLKHASDEKHIINKRKTNSQNNAVNNFDNVIIGMEPTGHYWKTLAYYLDNDGYEVVCVNPYHTKKAKELDDNSQTKSDKKDAITIARLIVSGRYFEPYFPQEPYCELRKQTSIRMNLIKHRSEIRSLITALLDEYFPEITRVFKYPIDGKASRQILRSCPFPKYILAMTEDELLSEVRKAVKKTVGIKKVRQLIETAKISIGVEYGLKTAMLEMKVLLERLEQNEQQLLELEHVMATTLYDTGYAESMLSIKGVRVVTAASLLGEIGNPLRFQSARQISNYAGLNLIEDSSGMNKSGTCISKRGRCRLRKILYQAAFTLVSVNNEFKRLYQYYTTGREKPLKKKQALIVIAKKVITVILALLKKKEIYNPELVFGQVRLEMMANAA
jgi:transposase